MIQRCYLVGVRSSQNTVYRGHAKASTTLDIYADLFDEDLDGVAGRPRKSDRPYQPSPAQPLWS
jgi:hypothetical protein